MALSTSAIALLPSRLRDLIHYDKANPSIIISHELHLDEAPNAYKHFDNRDTGWTKVILHPGAM